MYTQNELIKITQKQLALDYNCVITDFAKKGNTITKNNLLNGRRLYSYDGCQLKIVCYRGKAIITTDEQLLPWVEENLKKEDASWLFEYPKLRFIDKKLNDFGHEIADIHHYYIPDAKAQFFTPLFDIKWYEHQDIHQFKNDDRFNEALAFEENHPDMLAVAAFEGDRIMGMAGASADSKTMWQIGIDVIPGYRGKGVGANLTALLKQEILKRGKVPFYGTVESHDISKNIAFRAGFLPAWSEVHSQKKES
ncbi:GNAT family N-acetyltransferase [Gracilibacillus massiliensis]|uniref:GNAT family N-acetyltransferase n=1 Tax=Gracilibacillus massiliensis TaxID=1564956 RepID=UPI00071C3C8A|nr:GNAT family N-acetyltransferase [Gracilibacillus massiliensis]